MGLNYSVLQRNESNPTDISKRISHGWWKHDLWYLAADCQYSTGCHSCKAAGLRCNMEWILLKQCQCESSSNAASLCLAPSAPLSPPVPLLWADFEVKRPDSMIEMILALWFPEYLRVLSEIHHSAQAPHPWDDQGRRNDAFKTRMFFSLPHPLASGGSFFL